MYRWVITRVKLIFIFIERNYVYSFDIFAPCALLWKQRIIAWGWGGYKKINPLRGTILPFNVVLLDWSTRVLVLELLLLYFGFFLFFWMEGSGGTTCRYTIFYWFVKKRKKTILCLQLCNSYRDVFYYNV